MFPTLIQGLLLTAAQKWKFGDPTNEIVCISFKEFSRVTFFCKCASREYVYVVSSHSPPLHPLDIYNIQHYLALPGESGQEWMFRQPLF